MAGETIEAVDVYDIGGLFFRRVTLATYAAYEPNWICEAGNESPPIKQVYPDQTALWRSGDFLIQQTTGTITTPTYGVGTLAAAAAPSLGTSPVPFYMATASSTQTQGVVTVTAQTAASAPAQTYFCVVTYDITIASETVPSVPFVINCASGITPIVTVASAGAPALATTYAVYLSPLPNTFWLQHAVTALGSATNIAYPLTNRIGANKAAAAQSTGIIGKAEVDSDAYYAGIQGATAGGSNNTGKRSLFGATQSLGPGWTNDAFALPIVRCLPGLFEISLVQAWSQGLAYAAVGLNIDATTGYFVADTTQTQCATIEELAFGPGYRGDTGDIGARVRIRFISSAVA